MNDQTQVYLFFWWSTNISFFMHIQNLIRTYLVQIGDNYFKMKYKNLFCKNSKQCGFLNADFFLYWSSSTTITEFSVSWFEFITFFQFSCRFLEGSRRTSLSILDLQTRSVDNIRWIFHCHHLLLYYIWNA